MGKTAINTGMALGPYSSAVVAGQHCYVAGVGGVEPQTAQVVSGGIAAEIQRAFDNLDLTVKAAGFDRADVVMVTCYLRRLSDWSIFNEIYAGYFTNDPPARVSVEVSNLPAGLNVELSCIAWHDA